MVISCWGVTRRKISDGEGIRTGSMRLCLCGLSTHSEESWCGHLWTSACTSLQHDTASTSGESLVQIPLTAILHQDSLGCSRQHVLYHLVRSARLVTTEITSNKAVITRPSPAKAPPTPCSRPCISLHNTYLDIPYPRLRNMEPLCTDESMSSKSNVQPRIGVAAWMHLVMSVGDGMCTSHVHKLGMSMCRMCRDARSEGRDNHGLGFWRRPADARCTE